MRNKLDLRAIFNNRKNIQSLTPVIKKYNIQYFPNKRSILKDIKNTTKTSKVTTTGNNQITERKYFISTGKFIDLK